MYLHRRQFVIGPEKFIFDEGCKTFSINDGLWLSHCSNLRVVTTTDASGEDWYVLGFAVQTIAENESPEAEIARTAGNQVPALCDTWAGRWILVGDGKLFLDASGLLGCFYGRNAEGQLWASSSAALLSNILFSKTSPRVDSRQLEYEIGISWYTPPFSSFEGIFRLLPSQMLTLVSGEIKPKPLMPNINLDLDDQKLLGQIQNILMTTLQHLGKLSSDLWLGLTAGYDSRLMLALSQAAGIEVQPFTRITPRMSVADRILPPKLAAECSYPHTFIRNPKRHPEREKLAAIHTAGHVSQGDAEPFIQGVRDQMSGISFGGHGFSVASGFARLYELPEKVTSAEEGAKLIAAIFQEPVESSAIEGIRSWLSWTLEYPQTNLNWRDRFFIEQRQAGWLSSKEQLYDLTDLYRFPILNSAHLYSLMLSVSKEERLNSEIQKKLINNINPKLNQYPYNPDDFYFGLRGIVQGKGSDLPQYLLTSMRKKVGWLWNSLIYKF